MIYAGIDAGSRAIKAVLFDGERNEVVAEGAVDQGVQQERLAAELYDGLLAANDLDRCHVGGLVATGYGRRMLTFADRAVTEISCHARGVRHVEPDAATVVEIGGQDSKVIHLDGDGSVQDFAMNDRCAAGTGRFLEVVSDRLAVDLEALGDMAGRSERPAAISSMCVVFAETEIVGLLASGTSPDDIVAGVQTAIAKRVAAMAGRDVAGPVVFTGGVARVSGMTHALGAAMKQPIRVAADPHMTGALGAALLARGA